MSLREHLVFSEDFAEYEGEGGVQKFEIAAKTKAERPTLPFRKSQPKIESCPCGNGILDML